jgi:hypothetical protein
MSTELDRLLNEQHAYTSYQLARADAFSDAMYDLAVCVAEMGGSQELLDASQEIREKASLAREAAWAEYKTATQSVVKTT